jgi:hypothetical protein
MNTRPLASRPISAVTHAIRRAAGCSALAQAALIAGSLLGAGGVHAASTTGTFTVSMPVNSPTCTVANSNSTVSLPTVASPNQTLGNYFSTNAITTASTVNSGWYAAGSSLNQTATITCTTASTPILSFVVEQASGATGPNTAQTYLVDAATTPVKAGAGNFLMVYEQVSVNGTAAAFTYAGVSPIPYATSFTTSAVANGTATVVWRPVFEDASSTTAMGTPTGGSFNSPGQIVVNY